MLYVWVYRVRNKIKRLPNPYGDSKATEKIVEFLLEYLNQDGVG